MPIRDEPRLARIRAEVEAYCRENNTLAFQLNTPIVRLHEPTFGAEEIMAALECLLSTRVTMGPKVKGFEKEYAETFGHAHAVMSNSGSSANLLAVAAIANKSVRDHLRPGDEVVVSALSWSTTVWPLIQLGAMTLIACFAALIVYQILK